jgi:carbon monoxide dehydrogenase subunit G
MAGRFDGTAVIDRPIDEVFAFLADGENDPKFSPRVQEIAKTTDGPPGVGTTFASTVKDAGMTTRREFKITEFEAPARIRWTELSKNMVTVPRGGYDLAPAGAGTQLTIFNEFEGHGIGKLIVPLALRSARKDADDFAARIKAAVEAERLRASDPG